MNGEIAQIVALTCHGNAAFRREEIPRFFPSNSTCQFCDRITFVEIAKTLFRGQRERLVAQTPDSWFQYLAKNGARGVRLWRSPNNEADIPDRMLAGFVGGGGTWTMEVLLPSGLSALWIARWEVWNQDAPDNNIWRVTYGHVGDTEWSAVPESDLPEISERLLAALRDIRAFSEAQQCDGFTRCFDKGIESLTTSTRNGYHKDLAPEGSIPSVAAAILDACQSSWVFGGMGSWNDMGFDGENQIEYERVSEQLFEAIADSLACAATASSVVGRA